MTDDPLAALSSSELAALVRGGKAATVKNETPSGVPIEENRFLSVEVKLEKRPKTRSAWSTGNTYVVFKTWLSDSGWPNSEREQASGLKEAFASARAFALNAAKGVIPS